jgi:hypothetical protein
MSAGIAQVAFDGSLIRCFSTLKRGPASVMLLPGIFCDKWCL